MPQHRRIHFSEGKKTETMKKLTAVFCVLIIALLVSGVRSEPITDTFWFDMHPEGMGGDGGGSGYNWGKWYIYDSGWINQWFYDHPFDTNRAKIIHIEFDVSHYESGWPSVLEFAVNWSTPEWSYLGYGDTTPPTPDLVGQDEAFYIERVTLEYFDPVPDEVTHYSFDYVIPDYNPEWVSIDVRGDNFIIFNGVIEHECVEQGSDTEAGSWGAVKSIYR